MPYQIEMPHVGESVTEAVIGKWLKSPGDRVDKYDPIVEVITDKVTMEVPAPAAGTLTRIIAEEGETVPMGAVIAEMDAEGAVEEQHASSAEVVEAAEPASADRGREQEVPARTSAPVQSSPTHSLRAASADRVGSMITGANVGPTGGAFTDTSLTTRQADSRVNEQEAVAGSATMAQRLSPVVQRLASQHGIDPAKLIGTGLGGRVTKKDVERAIEERSGAASHAPSPATGTSRATEDQLVRPTAVRRMIADHMALSFREIPHAWSAVEVDVTGMVACRAVNRDAVQQRHGIGLTYLPFTLHEVSQALRSNPLLNSSWQDGKIILKSHINVGIAVAGKDGLVVPVVRDADRKGLIVLAKELSALVEKARTGKLSLGEVQDGTFTLNNTGALGSVWGGAIINHPQAAILTTEAIVKRPVIISTPESDAVAVRCMMNICLSFDHRVIDGAEASAFLQDVKRRLESIKADTELS